jgi:ribonuclease R
MLLANEIVASHLERAGIPTLYRVHDQPDPLKMKEFSDFVTSLGYRFRPHETVDPLEIQRLLTQVAGRKEEGLINELLLRSMKRALYSPSNIGHFGLACQTYTHFTSPIRRYPDLLVHRILRRHLHGTIDHAMKERLATDLPGLGDLTSERERIAEEAERDSVEVKQVEFLEDKLGEEYEGIISGVQSYGFFVALEESLIEGLVRVSWLEDDYYLFDDKRYCLTGRHTKRTFRLGDRLRVRVVRADPEQRQVDFLLVENEEYSRRKGKRRKGGKVKR